MRRSGSFGHQARIDEQAISKRFGRHHGGYPEPFISDATSGLAGGGGRPTLSPTQLVREDIRDLTQVQQIDQMEVLVQRLSRQSGRQLVYGNLAREVRVSPDTIRRWVAARCATSTWAFSSNRGSATFRDQRKRNVSRSLRKEPKWYLRDWADIEDVGEKAETFVACHLL